MTLYLHMNVARGLSAFNRLSVTDVPAAASYCWENSRNLRHRLGTNDKKSPVRVQRRCSCRGLTTQSTSGTTSPFFRNIIDPWLLASVTWTPQLRRAARAFQAGVSPRTGALGWGRVSPDGSRDTTLPDRWPFIHSVRKGTFS